MNTILAQLIKKGVIILTANLAVKIIIPFIKRSKAYMVSVSLQGEANIKRPSDTFAWFPYLSNLDPLFPRKKCLNEIWKPWKENES